MITGYNPEPLTVQFKDTEQFLKWVTTSHGSDVCRQKLAERVRTEPIDSAGGMLSLLCDLLAAQPVCNHSMAELRLKFVW